MATIGNIALVFSFLTMLYSIAVGYLGMQQDNWNFRQSARGAAQASFLFIVIASGILWHALMTSDFSLAYVANYTKLELPWYFKFSAFWAGQAGSLLFWLLLTAALPPLVHRAKLPENIGFGASAVMQLVCIGFLLILLTATPPFRTLAQVPADGSGLNPMLQSFGMIVHPPITFLGFALYTVPFAIVLVSLFQGTNLPWHRWIRPWLLGAWVALTAGIVTGGQWAYTELGWGGYWAWDPVENASLFPWLTSTALLHTLALQRRGRGFAFWNVILVFLSFILCIFGTFLTRSGLLDSVHAFSDSRVGQAFLMFIVVLIAAGAAGLFKGHRQLATTKSAPIVTMDGAFRGTNAILLFITVGVFIGTMMPYFSGWFGRSIALQESFYNQLTIPFWLALLGLFGLLPILRWFETPATWKPLVVPALAATAALIFLAVLGIRNWLALLAFALCAWAVAAIALDSLRQRGRLPAHMVHVGVVLIALGITGSLFNLETLQPVDPGDTVTIGRYTLVYDGLQHRSSGMYTTVSSTLDVQQGQRTIGAVKSSKVFHPTYHQPATNIGIFGSWREDIYFHLSGWDHDTAFLQISVKPLVAWIWLGSYLMYVGGLWLLWKRR